jgi:hypothetical protein
MRHRTQRSIPEYLNTTPTAAHDVPYGDVSSTTATSIRKPPDPQMWFSQAAYKGRGRAFDLESRLAIRSYTTSSGRCPTEGGLLMAVNHGPARLRTITNEAIAEATGHNHRAEPAPDGTGGPAGNARLTAWTGLLLLVLFAAELVTLLDVRTMITWHLAIGALLLPPALLKTASTGWRILRYYTGSRPYRDSGPPPLILRILGPLVVLTTIALLGSGLALVVAGPVGGRSPLVYLLGQRIDILTLHQAAFVTWAVVTGLHVLGRLIPALRLTVRPGTPGGVPGGYRRIAILMVTAAVAVVLAIVVVQAGHAWRTPSSYPFGRS